MVRLLDVEFVAFCVLVVRLSPVSDRDGVSTCGRIDRLLCSVRDIDFFAGWTNEFHERLLPGLVVESHSILAVDSDCRGDHNDC